MSDWFSRAQAVQGWMSNRELGFLYGVALSIPDGSTVVEVGSWKGRSTIAICEGLLGKRGIKVYAVDTFMGNEDNATMLSRHRTELGEDRVYEEFRENTAQYDFLEILRMSSADGSQQFAPGSIDWIFIDAQHTFEAVRNDIRWWYPRVAMGGLISGHDYFHFEVRMAVRSHLSNESSWESIWHVRRTQEQLKLHALPVVEQRARQVIMKAPFLERELRRRVRRTRRARPARS